MHFSFKLLLAVFSLLSAIIASAQETKIYLDPEAAISTSIGQLFRHVEFIPLQTIPESIFDRADDMVVTERYYIILDRSRNVVLFFDKQGNFLSVFQKKGYELLDLKYSSLDQTIFIQGQKRNYRFTQKQRFEIIESNTRNYFQLWMCKLEESQPAFHLMKNFQYSGYKIYPVAENRFLVSTILSSPDFPDSEDYEMQYVFNDTKTTKFFPYNRQNATQYYHHLYYVSFFKGQGTSVLFTRPYRYEIYDFKDGLVRTRYKFVFPASRSLPPNFFDRNLSTETSVEILRKEYQGAIQSILPVLSWDDHLIFWLTSLQPNSGKDFKQYLLDINTGTLIHMRLIKPDSISYNLPINFTGLVAQDDTSIYTFMFARELIDEANGSAENYPSSLKALIQRNDSKANPVIVRLIKK